MARLWFGAHIGALSGFPGAGSTRPNAFWAGGDGGVWPCGPAPTAVLPCLPDGWDLDGRTHAFTLPWLVGRLTEAGLSHLEAVAHRTTCPLRTPLLGWTRDALLWTGRPDDAAWPTGYQVLSAWDDPDAPFPQTMAPRAPPHTPLARAQRTAVSVLLGRLDSMDAPHGATDSWRHSPVGLFVAFRAPSQGHARLAWQRRLEEDVALADAWPLPPAHLQTEPHHNGHLATTEQAKGRHAVPLQPPRPLLALLPARPPFVQGP